MASKFYLNRSHNEMITDYIPGFEIHRHPETNSSYGNSQSIYAPDRIPMSVIHPSYVLHSLAQIRYNLQK